MTNEIYNDLTEDNFKKVEFHFGKFFYSYDHDTKKHNAILFDKELPDKVQPPVFLQVAVTNYCNLRCNYCYAVSSPKEGGKWNENSLYNFLYEAAACGVTSIAFGGGEPFSQDWFISLLNRLNETTPLSLSVTTNGTLITPDIASQLSEMDVEIRVSINTVQEFNKRGLGLQNLIDEGIIVGINSIACKENFDLFENKIPKLLKNAGVLDLLLLESQPIGRVRLSPLPQHMIVKRVADLHQKLGEFPLKISSSFSHLFQNLPGVKWQFPPELTQSKGFFGSLSHNGKFRHTSFCPSSCEVNIIDIDSEIETNFFKTWQNVLKKPCTRTPKLIEMI